MGRPVGALLAVAVALAIVAHIFALRFAAAHLALPAAAVVGVAALVAVKHVGLIAAAWTRLWRRPGSSVE